MNVILKSGTNDLHGSAYEFLQNSDFNARAFFNPSVGHLAYNYVGGNLGGPIKKNKIFYFGGLSEGDGPRGQHEPGNDHPEPMATDGPART